MKNQFRLLSLVGVVILLNTLGVAWLLSDVVARSQPAEVAPKTARWQNNEDVAAWLDRSLAMAITPFETRRIALRARVELLAEAPLTAALQAAQKGAAPLLVALTRPDAIVERMEIFDAQGKSLALGGKVTLELPSPIKAGTDLVAQAQDGKPRRGLIPVEHPDFGSTWQWVEVAPVPQGLGVIRGDFSLPTAFAPIHVPKEVGVAIFVGGQAKPVTTFGVAHDGWTLPTEMETLKHGEGNWVEMARRVPETDIVVVAAAQIPAAAVTTTPPPSVPSRVWMILGVLGLTTLVVVALLIHQLSPRLGHLSERINAISLGRLDLSAKMPGLPAEVGELAESVERLRLSVVKLMERFPRQHGWDEGSEG